MHIDWWTLALQTVNVLVLVWLLARFLFRPITEIVARRQDEANKLLSDAEAVQRKAAAERSEVERVRAGLDAERHGLIADARKAAELERQAMLAAAAKQIATLRTDASAQIGHEQAAMQRTLIDHARQLSIAIARRLLGRAALGTGVEMFLGGLCDEVRALPDRERTALVAGHANGDPLQVVTADPLSGEETERVRTALAAAFGTPLALTFRNDRDVIAGIELHSPHVVIRNSWRADLERMRQELSNVDELPR
jgi:F-type H+-transporting ATPase subunit b